MNPITHTAFVLTLGCVSASAAAQQVDEESGLIIAPRWETVKTNCTVCHSARLITAQRGSRETWQSIIRWMQKTQGLWTFDPKVETDILDYLEANYPPGGNYRRKPIPPQLMPP